MNSTNQQTEPALTDERLRTWLDGNQVDRERLCLSLLALDPRFRDVRPRHPKGGPDGGRDIEALMEDGREAWGAIAFRNHATDGTGDVSWVKSKFRKDLDAALKNRVALGAFIFMTNVALSNSVRETLIGQAHRRGVGLCDIFTRERLRILLDSPDGLGYRFQFLRIPMSDAEQAAFFARWGTAIEQAIQSNFSAVNKRLDRVEFVQEMSRPLRFLELRLFLKRPVTLTDMGHFRVLFTITSLLGNVYHKIGLTARDCLLRPSNRTDVLSGDFIECKVWVTPAKSTRPIGVTGGGLFEVTGATREIRAHSGVSFSQAEAITIPILGDLHGTIWTVFTTKPFGALVERIRLVANHYELLNISSSAFNPEDTDDPKAVHQLWPEKLKLKEKVIPWVQIKPFSPADHWFDFAKHTPPRITRPAPSWDFITKSVE